MSVLIKICGVTLVDDAARVVAAGADFVGINFWPRSKRHVELARAPLLATAARAAGGAKIVGVFVDPSLEEVERAVAAAPLDVVQLHGDESDSFVADVRRACGCSIWRAVSLASERDLDTLPRVADAILVDAPAAAARHATPGAPRVAIDLALAAAARTRVAPTRLVLAGGLTPESVAGAIAAVAPWCVDVASGVEVAPGIKDAAKVAAFISAARAAVLPEK